MFATPTSTVHSQTRLRNARSVASPRAAAGTGSFTRLALVRVVCVLLGLAGLAVLAVFALLPVVLLGLLLVLPALLPVLILLGGLLGAGRAPAAATAPQAG